MKRLPAVLHFARQTWRWWGFGAGAPRRALSIGRRIYDPPTGEMRRAFVWPAAGK